MGKNARREYLNAIRPRYKKADKAAKKAMLDEFCQVCGYHCKYAIRLLNKSPVPRNATIIPLSWKSCSSCDEY